ncbi:ABC transporter ATP-binding protein [Romeria aff. gracilis LEGE 07310]|uniref:ABC transporter ATP-binding protein n=1 Tax=Vasconcelosia minhoensis LEGE 07310 TaxID=915328 RepID=A0A8J7A685_9CYAN|nr:ABC transporter ATP-binding protein [Romeria gracilis]MBE9077417.1 ABC transporter ATP-binding protein [Romeria aff. gracilis LEGE 07310]
MLNSQPPLLQVKNLTKTFPVGKDAHLHAVDQVSFTLQSGESVGLVGESGCGKSTLVRLITRLLDVTAGEIHFDDAILSTIAVRQFPQNPYRAGIQLVFQDPTDSLNPRFTAYDTITEPIKRLSSVQGRQQLQARAAELADLVGLPQDLLSRFPHQLSGGQKARVGIARAIALNPKLLVLDEPTSALDVSVQAVILHLLADLKKRLGMSYLFVSHDLNVVRLLCDRVLVMYLGKIVESGPVEQIFNHPRHPYTEALISAIPSFTAQPHPIPLTGEPRSPINPNPSVCRLYGRCPKGEDLCHQVMPELTELSSNHQAACHFPVSSDLAV